MVGVATPDKWQYRVIRMLKGALMPPTWNCEIDLGPQFIHLDLNEDSFPWDKKRTNGTRRTRGNTSRLHSHLQYTILSSRPFSASSTQAPRPRRRRLSLQQQPAPIEETLSRRPCQSCPSRLLIGLSSISR